MEYQTESKRNKTSAMIFLGPEDTQETWECKSEEPRGGHKGGGRAPTSWAPRGSPDLVSLPIYTVIP